MVEFQAKKGDLAKYAFSTAKGEQLTGKLQVRLRREKISFGS
jgi:hypothetical protein